MGGAFGSVLGMCVRKAITAMGNNTFQKPNTLEN